MPSFGSEARAHTAALSRQQEVGDRAGQDAGNRQWSSTPAPIAWILPATAPPGTYGGSTANTPGPRSNLGVQPAHTYHRDLDPELTGSGCRGGPLDEFQDT